MAFTSFNRPMLLSPPTPVTAQLHIHTLSFPGLTAAAIHHSGSVRPRRMTGEEAKRIRRWR